MGCSESMQSKPTQGFEGNASILSDSAVLEAVERVRGGVPIRTLSRELGVSHTTLRKRMEKFLLSDGYQPDDLDRVIIRAVLDTGIPDAIGRLSDIMGWTRIELLEAARGKG